MQLIIDKEGRGSSRRREKWEMDYEKKKEHLWFLFQFLHEVEKHMSREEEKQVMIEKAINLRLMCDYVVSCSYGDLVLIICMLHDYVKMLDEMRAENINYQAYYRGKYLKMADRLAEQIGYDYEKKLEECLRKNYAEERNSDIGGDAVELSMKYGRRASKKVIPAPEITSMEPVIDQKTQDTGREG